MHTTKPGARPGVGYTNPAGGVLVIGAVAIPLEFDGDAAKFIGVQFFARRAGDHGSIRPLADGFEGGARRAIGLAAGVGVDAHIQDKRRSAAIGLVIIGLKGVGAGEDQILLVVLPLRVLGDGEQAARCNTAFE